VLARCNQTAEVNGETVYADARVRGALAMAVNHAVVLEIAYSGQGRPAENHHVSPIHPEYADIGAHVTDPEGALALMARLQQIMVDEGVIIQPHWRALYNHSKSNLKGAEIHISNELYPQYMYWKA